VNRTGEKSIQYTLPDYERLVGRQFLGRRTGDSDRPRLHHGVFGLFTFKVDLKNLLSNGVFALGGDLGDSTMGTRWKQNSVSSNERVLENSTPNVTTRDVVTNVLGGVELPLVLSVERGNRNSSRNINGFGDVGDLLQRSLNTVVYTIEQTRSKLD
jgi:hypothetical protein